MSEYESPDYYAAAAARYLAKAEHLEEYRASRVGSAVSDTTAFTRYMSLFEANATMARLALDMAKPTAAQEHAETCEVTR